MAVYTHVDRESLEAFLADYDLPRLIDFHGIEAGVENSNYWLETPKGKYILTLFEKRVKAEDLPFYMAVKSHLAEKGLNVPAPILRKDKSPLGILCGRPAALVTFLKGHSQRSATTAQAYSAGKLLAKLHLAADGFPQTRTNDLGPKEWRHLSNTLGAQLNTIAPNLHDELTKDAQYLADHWPHDLPCGVIHADYFPDNVMFEGDNAHGVIDFYFACTDDFAYDLAIAMNAFTPEDTHSPTAGAELLRGYQDIRPLTTAEVNALPLLLRGAALRFCLTRAYDWLHRVPDSLVQIKDPMPWVELLRAHRQSPSFFEGVIG